MYIGHELIARLIKMAGHFQSTEDVVQKLLIEMSGNQLKKVLIQQRKNFVPFGLVNGDVLKYKRGII